MYRRAENILTGGCLHLAYSLQSLLPNIAQNVQTAKQIFKFMPPFVVFLKKCIRDLSLSIIFWHYKNTKRTFINDVTPEGKGVEKIKMLANFKDKTSVREGEQKIGNNGNVIYV